MNKIPITVILPVKNEANNLPSCLERLMRFDQVLVVDSASTDATASIATSLGAELIQFKWNGKYPKKRNWTLENGEIRNDWVLFLDADEFVTEKFIKEVAVKIQNPNYNGYTLQFENHFMGKKLRYGYQLKKSALFKKTKGLYEKTEENFWSHLDMEVHEHPIIEGKVGLIKSKVIHKDFNTLAHYIAKHNAYSTWEAHQFINMVALKKTPTTMNQRIKYFLLKIGLLPYFYFIGTYFLKLGFLDGKEGYYLARYKSTYFFQIQSKVFALRKAANTPPNNAQTC